MSHTYRTVGWNTHKRAYDAVAATSALMLAALVAAGTWWRFPQVTVETALIRGFGITAFVLLHVVVVPLFSAAPPRRFLLDWNLACLLAHMLLIGIPAALMARRWYEAPHR